MPNLERFIPELKGRIAHEHFHRYLFALNFVGGKTVLDVASGEGFGSSLLASKARRVVGVDIDEASIQSASARYGMHESLEFVAGDCSDLQFPDACFDVVVSFETVEHIESQEALILQIKRVLKPDGLLIMSTPNRPVYSGETNLKNVFHVRELDEVEFRDLLSPAFEDVQMFGQRFALPSIIWPLDCKPQADQRLALLSFDRTGGKAEASDLRLQRPTYLVAVCGSRPVSTNVGMALHLDVEDDLWSEHDGLIRWASGVHDKTEDLQQVLREKEALLASHAEDTATDVRAEFKLALTGIETELVAARLDRARAMQTLAALDAERLVARWNQQNLENYVAEREAARAEATMSVARLKESEAKATETMNALIEAKENCQRLASEASVHQMQLSDLTSKAEQLEAEVASLRRSLIKQAEAVDRSEAATASWSAAHAEQMQATQRAEMDAMTLREMLAQQVVEAQAETSALRAKLAAESHRVKIANGALQRWSAVARVNQEAFTEIRKMSEVVATRRTVLEALQLTSASTRRLLDSSSAALLVERAHLRIPEPFAVRTRKLGWFERRVFDRTMEFDGVFYLQQYPDVAAAGVDPLEHYLSHGLYEDRDPTPNFSSVWYRLNAPDPVGDMPAYAHFLAHPSRRGWARHPLFDASYYIARHPDLKIRAPDAYDHFLQHGARERRDPHPLVNLEHLASWPGLDKAENPLFAYLCQPEFYSAPPHLLFDPDFYLAENDDVVASRTNPLLHYALKGWREGRTPHPLFAGDWYVMTNPDVRRAGVNPFVHYVRFGASEGRKPHPLFDTNFYLDNHPQLQIARGDALAHYLSNGAREGLETNRTLTVAAMRLATPDHEWQSADPISAFLRHGPDDIEFPPHYVVADGVAEASPRLAWPPTPRPAYILPGGLRSWLVERHGEDSLALYVYLMSLVERFGDKPRDFADSRDCETMRERLEVLCATISADGPTVEVSIVVPVYNNLVFTLTCVVSILENKSRRGYEIIVADDGSTDNTPEVFADLPSTVLLHRNATNLGFLGNCNAAAATARGRYTVMLNNDTLVMPNWLDELIEPFERDPAIGFTGSKLLNSDGSLQEAGGIFWRDGSAWNFGRNSDPRRPEFNYLKDVDYVSGASIAFPTDLWRNLRGFDPVYTPAYCEDSDIAFRVRALGLRTVFAAQSAVVHHEGKSHGRDTSGGIKAYQVINNAKLLDRWRATLEAENFPNGEAVFLARDRSRDKPHILIVDHYIPQWDRDAGSRTMYHFIRMFLQNGFHVTFWPDNLFEDVEYCRALQNMGVEVIYSSAYVDQFESFIIENGRFFDCVLLSRPHIAKGYYSAVRTHTNARVLYYGHDIHYRRMQLEAEADPSKTLVQEILEMRELEIENWRATDVVLYPSLEERDLVLEELPDAIVAQVPMLGYTDEEFAIGRRNLMHFEERQADDLVFVGGSHPPNIDALLWFTRDVFPLVLAIRPTARLNVVGASVHDDVRRMASASIVIRGRLNDAELGALYETAAAAIIPLRFGGGVKGKTIEALFHAVPLVATSVGMQGLQPNEPIGFGGDTAEAFAEAVIEALTDRAEAIKRVERGFAYIVRHYSIDAMSHAFAPFVPQITKRQLKRAAITPDRI